MPNSNDAANVEMLWERILPLLLVSASVLGGSAVLLIQALPPILHGLEAHGAHRYSDKEKFCSDLNHPEGCKMSERLLKSLGKLSDFQAEYEGLIPATYRKRSAAALLIGA